MDKLVFKIAQVHMSRFLNHDLEIVVKGRKEIRGHLSHLLCNGGGAHYDLLGDILFDPFSKVLLYQFGNGLFLSRVKKSVQLVNNQSAEI